MNERRLGEVEARFAEIIWQNEPLPSRHLAELAEMELGWKRTTTYTVLKRLCNRGLFQNRDGVVTALVSKQDFYALQSESFVEQTFDGSLPAFVAAFGRRKKLSDAEIDELQKIIEHMREERHG